MYEKKDVVNFERFAYITTYGASNYLYASSTYASNGVRPVY